MPWVYGWLEGLKEGDPLFYGDSQESVIKVYFFRVCWNPSNSYEGFREDRFFVEITKRRGALPLRVRASSVYFYHDKIDEALDVIAKARSYFDLFSKGQQASAMQVFGLDLPGARSQSRRGSSTIELPKKAVRHDLFLNRFDNEPVPKVEETPGDRQPQFVDFVEVKDAKQPEPPNDPIPF